MTRSDLTIASAKYLIHPDCQTPIRTSSQAAPLPLLTLTRIARPSLWALQLILQASVRRWSGLLVTPKSADYRVQLLLPKASLFAAPAYWQIDHPVRICWHRLFGHAILVLISPTSDWSRSLHHSILVSQTPTSGHQGEKAPPIIAHPT